MRQTYEPGMSVSLVAREHGGAASQLFNWRKLDRDGVLTAVGAGESVVPASEQMGQSKAQINRFPAERHAQFWQTFRPVQCMWRLDTRIVMAIAITSSLNDSSRLFVI